MGRVAAILLIFGLVVGCNRYTRKQQNSPIMPPSNFKASELNFSSVYRQVLRPSCIGCHGSSGGVSLESYGSVKANISKIYDSVIVQRNMPKLPTASLTDWQLGLLNAWIGAGAPEDSGTGEAPIPPLEPNFASIKTHILEVKCLSCHASGKPVARILLVTKEDLLNSPLDIVVPGNPEESGIILAVTNQDPQKKMPPVKDEQGNETGYAPLSDEEVGIISLWINNGAKD